MALTQQQINFEAMEREGRARYAVNTAKNEEQKKENEKARLAVEANMNKHRVAR